MHVYRHACIHIHRYTNIICIHIYTYTRTYIYAYTYTFIDMYVCKYAGRHVCVYVCMCVHIHLRTPSGIRATECKLVVSRFAEPRAGKPFPLHGSRLQRAFKVTGRLSALGRLDFGYDGYRVFGAQSSCIK